MRQLRFDRPADDGNHLVVSTVDGTEQFVLAVDARLREAAGSDLPRLPRREPMPAPVAAPAPVEPPVEIGPREIQIRVRGGESPRELAESLGVPLDRVLRFAGPVVEERLRIADEARRARARRNGIENAENAVVVFGEAVDGRFTAHGIVPVDVTWDSHRREDGEWVVVARWSGGAGEHTAQWLFHRGSRSVTPLDETAADLLSDRPIRPIMAPAAPEPALSMAPPLAPGVVAFPVMPDAHTGPLPRIEDVYDQEATAEGPRDVPPFVPDPPEPGLPFDEPLPLGLNDAEPRTGGIRLSALKNLGVHKREESDDDKAARARVPSWDDILLGVRRKQD
jgi:hypothetical protein